VGRSLGCSCASSLGSGRPLSGQNRCSERPARGHPARLGSRNPAFCSKPVRLGLLQEWLRTAALAKRTRDASSTRARLSLSTQRFRGVGQGGWCGGVSGSSPRGRPTPPLADRIGRKSLRVSRGAGCRVKTGSVPLERSLPPGSAPLVRSRTGAAFGSARMAPAYPVPAPAGFGHDRVQASRCGDSECSCSGR
jgi:hypothetical protein